MYIHVHVLFHWYVYKCTILLVHVDVTSISLLGTLISLVGVWIGRADSIIPVRLRSRGWPHQADELKLLTTN